MLGSRLPARAPERVLRVVLAATLVLAGSQLLRVGRVPERHEATPVAAARP
jgi:hypothetical protein